jgi:hypothetical protein
MVSFFFLLKLELLEVEARPRISLYHDPDRPEYPKVGQPDREKDVSTIRGTTSNICDLSDFPVLCLLDLVFSSIISS